MSLSLYWARESCHYPHTGPENTVIIPILGQRILSLSPYWTRETYHYHIRPENPVIIILASPENPVIIPTLWQEKPVIMGILGQRIMPLSPHWARDFYHYPHTRPENCTIPTLGQRILSSPHTGPEISIIIPTLGQRIVPSPTLCTFLYEKVKRKCQSSI